MRLHRAVLLLAALASLAFCASASAQLPPLGPAGNGIFNIYANPAGDVGAGDFTITTGPDNLAGSGQNVLYGNGQPNTTYMEVYDGNAADNVGGGDTVYVEGGLVTQPDQVNLDTKPVTVVPLGSTGYEITWTIGQPDLSSITQIVRADGSTEANSSVEVTTSLKGAPDDYFLVEYLWDYELGNDDGPAFQVDDASGQFDPFAPLVTDENEYVGESLPSTYTVVDNDGNANPPNFAIGATVTGGPSSVAPPTAPVELQYACWPKAVLADIDDYTITPGYDISTPASTCLGPVGNDSAVIYQFPVTFLDSSGNATVSASLFMSPGTPDPTALSATANLNAIHPNTSTLTATLTDTKYNEPIAGRTVVFATSKQTLCTAVTDATGTATCTRFPLAPIPYALLTPITATYAGGAIWGPASVKAKFKLHLFM